MRGSVQRPSVDYKSLWDKYQGWAEEDKSWYEKEKGSTQARLGASGMKKGTPEWDRALEGVESQYAEKQQTLLQGATGSQLMSGARIEVEETPASLSL